MKLPGSAKALVEERKVRDYLMNPSHPDGAARARFFVRRGYRSDDWERLAEDLRRHAMQNEVIETFRSSYGTRYAVEGLTRTPSGEDIRLITVWIVEEGAEAARRLVTAYPA